MGAGCCTMRHKDKRERFQPSFLHTLVVTYSSQVDFVPYWMDFAPLWPARSDTPKMLVVANRQLIQTFKLECNGGDESDLEDMSACHRRVLDDNEGLTAMAFSDPDNSRYLILGVSVTGEASESDLVPSSSVSTTPSDEVPKTVYVRMVDLQSGLTTVSSHVGHKADVRCIAGGYFRVFTADEDGHCCSWRKERRHRSSKDSKQGAADLQTAHPYTLQPHGSKRLHQAAILQMEVDTQFLYTLSSDQTIGIWHVRDMQAHTLLNVVVGFNRQLSAQGLLADTEDDHALGAAAVCMKRHTDAVQAPVTRRSQLVRPKSRWGSSNGSCRGQAFPMGPLYVTVETKLGDGWLLVYYLDQREPSPHQTAADDDEGESWEEVDDASSSPASDTGASPTLPPFLDSSSSGSSTGATVGIQVDMEYDPSSVSLGRPKPAAAAAADETPSSPSPSPSALRDHSQKSVSTQASSADIASSSDPSVPSRDRSFVPGSATSRRVISAGREASEEPPSDAQSFDRARRVRGPLHVPVTDDDVKCRALRVHSGAITAMVYGPYDNGPVITASEDRSVRAWEATSLMCQGSREDALDRITAMRTNPPFNIITCSPSRIRLWTLINSRSRQFDVTDEEMVRRREARAHGHGDTKGEGGAEGEGAGVDGGRPKRDRRTQYLLHD